MLLPLALHPPASRPLLIVVSYLFASALLYEFFQHSTSITREWNLKKMMMGMMTRWRTIQM